MQTNRLNRRALLRSTPAKAATENRKFPSRGPRRTRYESFWPEGALGQRYPGEQSLAWTNWPLYTVGLVAHGYRDDDIRQILGLNMLRVTSQVLAAREDAAMK